MNKHYFIVLAAFLLAQALMASIMVYNYQKDKNIPYGQALYAYLKAEVGFFIIGLIGILGVCFLLSDYIDLSLTKADLVSQEKRTWKVVLQLYFKTCSFVLGGFIQYIAFIYKKKGKIAIDNAADKLVP
jgi:hypothetical protein